MDIDREAERLVRDAGALPAFKGYRGFPGDGVRVGERRGGARDSVGGAPAARGDILSLDMGVKLEGFYGDCAITAGVGRIDAEVERLLQVTRESLELGIAQVRVGGRVSDIGHAVQAHVERHGFSVVREFVGHGIGVQLHEEPQVPNYGPAGRGPRLAEGMVIAIEPMVNMGKAAVKVLGDGWTAVTVDGALSAHFEHTVAVTPAGPWILTALDGVRRIDRPSRTGAGRDRRCRRERGGGGGAGMAPVEVEGRSSSSCRARCTGCDSRGRPS